MRGTPGGGGPLGNWQVKGGTGAYLFDIDRETGVISLSDRSNLDVSRARFTLVLMVSDGILPSHDETVTINLAPAEGR